MPKPPQSIQEKPKTRNAIGMMIMIIGLSLYVLIAATFGNLISIHPLVDIFYYIIAGIIWIFPARWLLNWMANNKDSHQDKTP